jgi:hypothetical protein
MNGLKTTFDIIQIFTPLVGYLIFSHHAIHLKISFVLYGGGHCQAPQLQKGQVGNSLCCDLKEIPQSARIF